MMKNALAVAVAFAVSLGLSMCIAYVLVRAYCEAAEMVYLIREEPEPDDAPPPSDVTAMMNEVRRIVREAGSGS